MKKSSPFSLRLGHARVLTSHRDVIHYAHAASLLHEHGVFLFAKLFLLRLFCPKENADEVNAECRVQNAELWSR